jgi:SAM-dependent methyltransferase
VSHQPIEGVEFAEPRPLVPVEGAYWYHYVDWPDGTSTPGRFDLRQDVEGYLGRQDFSGRNVLELGPGVGMLTKEMAARGAAVTCVDTADDEPWDVVPRRDIDLSAFAAGRMNGQRRLRGFWWYTQEQWNTGARVAYCGASALSSWVGRASFDVALIGTVLLHLRNPVQTLYDIAKLAETIVVTEPFVPELEQTGLAEFLPATSNQVIDSWWRLSSAVVCQVLATALFQRTAHYTHVHPVGPRPQAGCWPEGEHDWVDWTFYTSVFERLGS